MDYKYIEQLLERYWNCETTLEEEDILRAFFSQKDVPVRLLAYRDLFCYAADQKRNEHLGDDFDRRMMALVNEPQPVKARVISMRSRMWPMFKAAAVVAIFLTLGNASQVAFTDSTQPATAVDATRPHMGPSVAMGDSAHADTARQAQALPSATLPDALPAGPITPAATPNP